MSEPVDTTAVRAYTNIETAFHDGLWIRESDYDSLQSALATAQQRLSEQETLLAERNRQNAAAFGECDRLRKLIEDHNADCQARCGVGDQEAVRCGYRPYLVCSGRRCPECPTYETIDIPIDAAMGAKEGM